MRFFPVAGFVLAGVMSTAVCLAQNGSVNAAPETGASQSVVITESQNGQTVSVPVGSDVAVTFVAASGTGYQWQLAPLTSVVAVPGDRQIIPAHPGLPGGPEKTVLHFKIKAAGTVTLYFSFLRPWEKNAPPAKTFSVTLQAR